MEPNNTNINTESKSQGPLIGFIIVLLVLLVGAGTYLYYNKAVAPTQPEDNGMVASGNCGLTVESPAAGSEVSFPLTLTGRVDNTDTQARGCAWALFEGQAGTAALSYETKDGWSLPVDIKPVMVTGDWMTTGPVPFTVTLNFDNSTEQFPVGYHFKVIFTEEDPSGMVKVDTVEVPVVLK